MICCTVASAEHIRCWIHHDMINHTTDEGKITGEILIFRKVSVHSETTTSSPSCVGVSSHIYRGKYTHTCTGVQVLQRKSDNKKSAPCDSWRQSNIFHLSVRFFRRPRAEKRKRKWEWGAPSIRFLGAKKVTSLSCCVLSCGLLFTCCVDLRSSRFCFFILCSYFQGKLKASSVRHGNRQSTWFRYTW